MQLRSYESDDATLRLNIFLIDLDLKWKHIYFEVKTVNRKQIGAHPYENCQLQQSRDVDYQILYKKVFS